MGTTRGAALLLVGLAGCGVPAPVPTAPDRTALEAEIVAARDRVWRAWFSGDSAGLVEALPDSMVGMGETTEEIIANALAFAAAGNRLVTLGFSDSEFILTDTMAVVVANYRAETARGDSVSVMSGRAIEVFVREDGRWVNPYWHLHE